jgi:hypothetical protein
MSQIHTHIETCLSEIQIQLSILIFGKPRKILLLLVVMELEDWSKQSLPFNQNDSEDSW